MKKHQKIVLHGLLITFMIPSVVLGIQFDGVPTKSVWRRATETVKEKLPTIQSLRARLPALQDKFTQASSIIKQKSYCLFKYEACTKRDKLLISNAFGFMAGYGISYRDLRNRMIPTPKLKIGVTILDVVAMLAPFMGLSGALFWKRGMWYLPELIQGYSAAKSKAVWLDAMKMNYLLLILVALDAYSILKEAAFAFQYDGKPSLRNVARYLRMNAQCIWSEQYCMPKEQAESRRNGLYFWLGFIEGALLYQLKIRTWGKREYERAPMPPAEKPVPIEVTAEQKTKIDHLKDKKGTQFSWYEILDVKADATSGEIGTAYHTLAGKYHPDKHPGDPEYAEVMKIINEAHGMAMGR